MCTTSSFAYSQLTLHLLTLPLTTATAQTAIIVSMPDHSISILLLRSSLFLSGESIVSPSLLRTYAGSKDPECTHRRYSVKLKMEAMHAKLERCTTDFHIVRAIRERFVRLPSSLVRLSGRGASSGGSYRAVMVETVMIVWCVVWRNV
jgi:hypothetical protein